LLQKDSRQGLLSFNFLLLGSFFLVFNSACSTEHNALVKADTVEVHQGNSILAQAIDDGKRLSSSLDFYLVVGSLGAAPFVFHSALNTESVSLNNRWHNSSDTRRFFSAGSILGQPAVHVAGALVGLGIAKILGSESLQSFSSDLLRAQGFNGVITLSMKTPINRTRPSGDAYSYPSGHTSTAFTTAGVVYRHFGKTWGAVAAIGAAYVGLSRIADNKHFLSDVVGGAILGSYIGLRIGRSPDRKRQLSVAPTTSFGHGGLAFALRF
jgi:membrane-associated phospholipid phosphatase